MEWVAHISLLLQKKKTPNEISCTIFRPFWCVPEDTYWLKPRRGSFLHDPREPLRSPVRPVEDLMLSLSAACVDNPFRFDHELLMQVSGSPVPAEGMAPARTPYPSQASHLPNRCHHHHLTITIIFIIFLIIKYLLRHSRLESYHFHHRTL